MQLTMLKQGQSAVITAISPSLNAGHAVAHEALDAISNRLITLGFIPGEKVRVLAKGLFGQDPILVQIGFTRFALRRTEAARIRVERQA